MCKLAKYVRNCVVLWKNLHSWQKIYTTAGRDGRDKFQVWSCDRPFWFVSKDKTRCKNIVWNLKWKIFCVGHASAVWPGGQFWWTNDVESLVLSLFLARTRTREGVNGRNFTDPQNSNAQYFSRKPISFKASLSLPHVNTKISVRPKDSAQR